MDTPFLKSCQNNRGAIHHDASLLKCCHIIQTCFWPIIPSISVRSEKFLFIHSKSAPIHHVIQNNRPFALRKKWGEAFSSLKAILPRLCGPLRPSLSLSLSPGLTFLKAHSFCPPVQPVFFLLFPHPAFLSPTHCQHSKRKRGGRVEGIGKNRALQQRTANTVDGRERTCLEGTRGQITGYRPDRVA